MSKWMQNLFSNSPFGPFQDHMRTVENCYNMLPKLTASFCLGDMDEVRSIARKVSQMEHEADKIKNSVRDHLPNSMFMPVGRSDLLDVLSAQDDIADEVEDVAVLMTMAKVPHDETLDKMYNDLVTSVVAVCDRTAKVVHSMDELLEASFSKLEVRGILDGIVEVCQLEHESDKIQDQLVRELYARGEAWPAPHFILWNKIVQETGAVANAAERMANRLRMVTS